jgi:hypothetical protein
LRWPTCANGDTYTRLAQGFAVGVATVFRYIREAADLLAACAPTLTAALWQLAHNGHNLGILMAPWYASTASVARWTASTTRASTTITASTSRA